MVGSSITVAVPDSALAALVLSLLPYQLLQPQQGGSGLSADAVAVADNTLATLMATAAAQYQTQVCKWSSCVWRTMHLGSALKDQQGVHLPETKGTCSTAATTVAQHRVRVHVLSVHASQAAGSVGCQ